jgi:hypothetical protein
MPPSLRNTRIGRSIGDEPGRRAAAAAVAALALCAVVGVLIAVVAAGGGSTPDNAIAMVPADAYVYAHVETDPGNSQVQQASSLAARFPHFGPIAQGLFQTLGGGRVDLARDVLPWLGGEAAAAEVPAPGGAPQPLLLLAIGDASGARQFAQSVGGKGGLASTERDGFLLLGSRSALTAAAAAADGRAPSLASDDTATEVRDTLPPERLADAYVSQEGIGRLLSGRPGAAQQLDTFTDFGASRGIGAALVAEGNGLELRLSSLLDPGKAKAEPPFFAAFPVFEPSLASTVAPDTLALLSIGDPSSTVRRLLDQADAAVPGISAAFDRLDRTVARQGNVGITRDVLPLLQDEAAVAIAPGRAVPYVTLVFDNVDEQKASDAVAGLLVPLIHAVNPAATGQAPTVTQKAVGGTTLHSVRLSPAVDLSYAVTDGRLIVSTDPRGVEQAVSGSDNLASQPAYRAVTAGAPGGVSALVFLNLKGLVQLAKPLGLARIVAGFDQDVARLEALGLTVKSGSASLDTRIFLEIAKP